MDYSDPKYKKEKYEILRSQLDNERSSFIPHWKDIGNYFMPRRPRFTVWENNRGDKKNQKIIDATGVLALRTLRSGMMSGVTSPARPWFRLTTQDPQAAQFGPIKDWLYQVEQRMSTIFLRSNLYNILPIIYGDMGGFGTAAMFVDEDINDIMRFYSFPIGSYMIANNDKLQVNVFMREFRLTVRQVVEKFGKYDPKTGKPIWDNFSTMVKNMWDRANYEAWVELRHIIEPNDNYKKGSVDPKRRKFNSAYYEAGMTMNSASNYMNVDDGVFLREAGYDYFPVLCPRWEISGEDVYGTDCPGMSALSDCKALQSMQKRKLQAIEKMVNPPMQAPPSMKNVKTSILPGDINYLSEQDGGQGFKPVHEVNPRLQELGITIQDTRELISKAFYEDLFLMLEQSDRRQITAREIDERHDEKLLALGPVLEQLNQDLLDPLIDNAFDIMLKRGEVPNPPDALRGQVLKVEYISIMAQAQKLVGISGVERFAGFVSQIGQVKPEALDKLDSDKLIDLYGEMTSVPPGIIRTDEDVSQIRNQRAQAAQQQAQSERLQAVSAGAKNLSQTSLDGNNALSAMINDANAGSLVQ